MKEITRNSLEVVKAVGTQAFVQSAFASGCFSGTVALSTLAISTACRLLKCTPEGRALEALGWCVLVLGGASSVAGARYIDEKCGLSEATGDSITDLHTAILNENDINKVSAREVKVA